MLVVYKSLCSSGAYAAPECSLLGPEVEYAILADSFDVELGAGDDLGIGQEFDF